GLPDWPAASGWPSAPRIAPYPTSVSGYAPAQAGSATRPDQHELHQLAALHQHADGFAALGLGHRRLEVPHTADLGVADRQDHVAFAQAGARTGVGGRFHAHAVAHLQLLLLGFGEFGDGQAEHLGGFRGLGWGAAALAGSARG